MDIIASLTSELNVGRGQVEAAVKLIDEGNTIPFIARYRKEATGSLNDEVLRTLDERLRYLRGLEEKKAQVMASIADQGKLTGELKKKIGEARTMVAVDDLYLPYRPKRKTRASMARERGLEPLADWIASQNAGTSLEDAAKPYVSEEKGVDSVKTAIAGAKDILAERIAEDAGYRTWVREITMNEGRIASEVRGGSGVRIRKILSPRGTGKELSRPPCPGLKPGGKGEDPDGEGGSTGGKDPPVSGDPCDHREGSGDVSGP